MKATRIKRFIIGTSAAALVGLSLLIPIPANAAHEMIYAVDQDNNLFNFWSDAPGTILGQYAINGVQNAEEIRGLDYWNGTLYGLGSFGYLYTITTGGIATPVDGLFAPPLSGATFGVDNGPSGFQVVGNLGQNLLIDRTTGQVISVGPNVPTRVDALAYDPVSGNWYAGNTLSDNLATLNPITGVLSPIGPFGIDASRYNGLDISPFSGIMYMGTPAVSSDPQANLYTISTATGFATLVGQIGQPNEGILVRGLTVVPEPGGVALLALGALGLLFARRQQ